MPSPTSGERGNVEAARVGGRPAEVLTVDVALANAARLLRNAEVETNHATMERLEHLADTWVNIANLLRERERV